DENEDRGGTREINEGQEIALGHEGAEPARGHRADDVEEPDRRDGPTADLRREAAIDEIRRHVNGDERELEATGEEAEHQQHIGPVTHRLRKRRRNDCDAGPPDAPVSAGAVVSASESGSTSNMPTPTATSVVCQPKASIIDTATGE